MKRLFTFFFALLSVCTFSTYAAIVEGTCGDNLTWTLNTKDSTLTISGTGAMTNYYPASQVPWSNYRSYIKYVTIEDGLTSIGRSAFKGCSSLTSITIPNSVTSIGNFAFDGCIGLTSITIPNSVTSIGDDAFSACSRLTSITIPNSVTSIGEWAFNECYSLTSVTIGNSVTSIGDYAFYNCSGLTSIVVEQGNAKYDSRENCNAIIETATNNLISGCQNTTIPNSVTSIGYQAFATCSSLTSITIPNSVTEIGNEAFFLCSGLTSVTLGNSVKSIGDAAFQYCTGLNSVTLGNSVTSIGDWAFAHCDTLTSITIPNSVTSIGDWTFYECDDLTSITIPNSVTSIGESAFERCYSLNSVTLGNSVTSIGDRAFADCRRLTSITIPNSVKSIGYQAFNYCFGLTSVTLGNSVTSIGDWAFSCCSKIREVTSYAATPPAATSCGLDQTVCTLYVPAEYIDTYSNTLWWEDFKEIRAIAQYEEGADKEFEVIFSDQDNNELSAQTVTLYVPVAPQIEGFTFLYWQPVAAPLDDVITIQAVYGSNTPTEAPEVFVNPSNPAQKLIRNGQVYILHEDKMYTISGQVVK